MPQTLTLPPPPSHLLIAIAGIMLALTLASLDQNIVSPALPKIVSDLGGLKLLAWVVTAFMVASTTTAPLYGKLGDLYGRKRAFYVSIVLFLAGSVLCGQARGMGQLIGFRALQGLGAGGLITLAQTSIADLVTPRERARYQGLFAGVFALCSVAGPLLGGVITDNLTWRWIFYVNLPVGGVALALLAAGLPDRVPQARKTLDLPGAGLLIVATVLLLLVLSCGGTVAPWRSPWIVAGGLVSALLFALLRHVERGAADPILSPEVFSNRVVVTSMVTVAFAMMSIFGTATFLPLYFQLELGATPTRAGLMMTPMMGGVIVSSVLGGRLVSRTGRYKALPTSGLAVATLASLALGWFTHETAPIWCIELALGGIGLGLGLVMPNLTTAVQNAVERRIVGVATSAMGFFRSLGAAVGVALAGALLNALLAHSLNGAHYDNLDAIRTLPDDVRDTVALAYRHAISSIFTAGAGCSAIACAVSRLVPELPLRDREHP